MERVMASLANHFVSKHEVCVDVVLIGRKREIQYELPDAVKIHIPPFTFDNNKRSWHTLRTMYYLRNKVKKINPDAILSFGEMWNNLVLLSLLATQYPVYISDRSKPGKDLGKVHNFLRNNLYPTAAGYIAQTQIAADICIKKGWNDRVTVIGNPIRQITIDEEMEKENTILFVGRLIRTKHIDRLIKIFSEIKSDDWKLIIVGGDHGKSKLSNDLTTLIHELELEDSVCLEGYQSNIEKYYRSSKIFAFPSSSEGFPNVIGEALSAGIPVVAYDCIAGPSEMIDDGENGFLVPVHDEKMFREKLEYLVQNEEKRREMGRKARTSVEKFQVEKIGEKFYETITTPE
jgi:GalNAc-alpha-(1->4)-GalNAc-alpha-(1->3)-diNAcBac-PP-undecaprenol alpha-1,4-N-acetyl-D-galactosaminyltransferase